MNDPSAVIPPAGCTILQSSRCPHGEGSTSGTKPPPFATPSVSIPPWFSCRDTVGKSARLRAGWCCHPYPAHYRTAFAFSHPPTRTALGWPCDLPTFLSEGAIRAYHVPQGWPWRVRCSLFAGSVGCPWQGKSKTLYPLQCHFGPSLSASLACLRWRRLARVHMCSPYRQSSPISAWCWQIHRPLTVRVPVAWLWVPCPQALYGSLPCRTSA